MTAATLRLRTDTRALRKALRAFRSEFQRHVHLRDQVAQLLFGSAHLAVEMTGVDRDRHRARRAGELMICAEPAKELLALVLAMRAFNVNLRAIELRLKTRHKGASGVSGGRGCSLHPRAGARLRQLTAGRERRR